MTLMDLYDDINGETVRDIMKAKHPPAAMIEQSAVISGTPLEPPHPVRFETLTMYTVKW